MAERTINADTVAGLKELLSALPDDAKIGVGEYGLVVKRTNLDGIDLISLPVSKYGIAKKSWNYGGDFNGQILDKFCNSCRSGLCNMCTGDCSCTHITVPR